MKPWKHMLLVLCLLSMLAQQQANAQAMLAPVENYVVNRAVAGIIANRIAVAEGIAANDAIWLTTKAANDSVFKATMAGVSSQMTVLNVAATVAGGALAIAGAPVWLTIAAGLGITALGAYFISSNAAESISIMQSGSSVLIKSQSIPSKVAYAAPTVTTPTTPTQSMRSDGLIALSAGLMVYRGYGCDNAECLAFPAAPENFSKIFPFYRYGEPHDSYVIAAYTTTEVLAFYKAWYQEANKTAYFGTQTTKTPSSVSVVPKSGSTGYQLYLSGATTTKTPAVIDPGGAVTTPETTKTTVFTELQSITILDSAQTKTYTNLTDAYASMTDAQKAIALPASNLAKIADEAWRRAAQQPGYQGLPYSATQPISSADVATWQSANPNAMPTLGDMLRPAQNPAHDPDGVPISPTVTISPSTGTSTGTGTTTNPGAGTNTGTAPSGQVNLGDDPGVPDPVLEDAPDAATILSPLTSLFPELQSYQAPSHSAECPRPVFEVFGKSIVMDSQCTIAEQHRAALGAVMLAVWALVGLLILLSA